MAFKKNFGLFILLLLITGCAVNSKQEHTTQDGEPMLLGKISRTDLEKMPYADWFNSEYEAYVIDTSALAKADLTDMEILLFMGTWCSDSQREVPRLYKILDYLQFDEKKVNLIAVDEDKLQPAEAIKKWQIEYVPTIIFLKAGEETGRIVEAPEGSLEEGIRDQGLKGNEN